MLTPRECDLTIKPPTLIFTLMGTCFKNWLVIVLLIAVIILSVRVYRNSNDIESIHVQLEEIKGYVSQIPTMRDDLDDIKGDTWHIRTAGNEPE